MRRLVAYGRYSVSADSVSQLVRAAAQEASDSAGDAPNRYISSQL